MKEEKSSDSSEKTKDREPYVPPELCVYGPLERLTQMPGGSVQAEGNSGKPHKKNRPGGGKKGKKKKKSKKKRRGKKK